MEQLVQEANVIPSPEAIAEAVNLIVFIAKAPDQPAGRVVQEILEVKGYDRASGQYQITHVT